MMPSFRPIRAESLLLLTGLVIILSAYVLSAAGLFTPVILRIVGLILVAVWGKFLWQRRLTYRTTQASSVIAVILALTFFQGFLSYPTTTDAHNYHIPRAIYWLDQRSIFQDEIYTSHDFMGAYPSIVFAILMSVSGGDRLLFAGQWLSLLACLFLVGKLARELELKNQVSDTVLILTATIPIVVLQASSTQVDMMSVMWLLLAVVCALRWAKKQSFTSLLMVGMSVALGILAKATMYIYAIIPFLILVSGFVRAKEKKVPIVQALVVSFLVLVILAPYWIQNKHLYNSYLGDSYTIDGQIIPFTVETFTPVGILSNVYRNILMHIPLGPLAQSANRIIEPVFVSLGTSFADPRFTWFEQRFSHLTVPIPQEDIAPAPLQMGLILIAGFFLWKRSANRTAVSVYLATGASFVLFSTLLLWQSYHARQHIALFFVWIPTAVALIPFSSRVWRGVCAVSIMAALGVIVANTSRPYLPYQSIYSSVSAFAPPGFSPPASIIFGRHIDQLFLSRPYWYDPYVSTVNWLAQHRVTSVYIQLDEGYNYPFIVLANKKNIRVTRDTRVTSGAKVVAGLSPDYNADEFEWCTYSRDARHIICIKRK